VFQRHIVAQVIGALGDNPVVLLHGARQTGKTTLARYIAAGPHRARYLTLDDAAVIDLLALPTDDTSPLVIALGARIELHGPAGSRSVDAASFYNDDGIQYLRKQPDELVTGISLPSIEGGQAGYVKVSRRSSVDFPVLSVAAWVRRETPQAPVLEARVVLGAVGSAPVIVEEAARILKGRPLSRESIEGAAEAAGRRARPLDNADVNGLWRKRVVRPYVARALEQLEPS